MEEDTYHKIPKAYPDILQATEKSGFSMASDVQTCSLLRTLAASKPGGQFLELGTGTGLSTSWILDGMCMDSHLISIDNDQSVLDIASSYLGLDPHLTLICSDGGDWVEKNGHLRFDYLFADTWYGKYLLLDEVLDMLLPGGLYILDDMLAQPNWPAGHHEKADSLVEYLDTRKDLTLTRLHWATGIIVAVKK